MIGYFSDPRFFLDFQMFFESANSDSDRVGSDQNLLGSGPAMQNRSKSTSLIHSNVCIVVHVWDK